MRRLYWTTLLLVCWTMASCGSVGPSTYHQPEMLRGLREKRRVLWGGSSVSGYECRACHSGAELARISEADSGWGKP